MCRELWQKQGNGYDAPTHTRFVDGLLAAFSPEFFDRVRGFGLETERPIFIVGLPRSGTTLTEQILASHSQIYGAGELNYLRETFETIPRLLGPGSPLEAIKRLDAPSMRQLAEWHLGRLAELNADASRVADKMPENYLYLGLIAALFPRAKLIHCRRDLRDVAVSCWMTNFRHLRWAADPEQIVQPIPRIRASDGPLENVLPVPVLEVDYEDTVADLEGVARRLVAWVGLEWEPACLAFHETPARAHRQRHAGTATSLHAFRRALEALRGGLGIGLRAACSYCWACHKGLVADQEGVFHSGGAARHRRFGVFRFAFCVFACCHPYASKRKPKAAMLSPHSNSETKISMDRRSTLAVSALVQDQESCFSIWSAAA